MHGLANRAIQRFVEDSHGATLWAGVAAEVGLRDCGFDPMRQYDDALTAAVLEALSRRLSVPREMLLEDVGTYLVSHPQSEALRRLLRFGGETFGEFLQSLDDLPDRARLAVPDLCLPALELAEHAAGRCTLVVGPGWPGFGHVLLGVLRAMADDYGALVLVEVLADTAHGATLAIAVAEATFAEGRRFELAPGRRT